ncbi:MAG TPA: hypothetical protein PJ994_05030 [Tepidiformaceae bacterium]|nr:hypothetical protein [Tepidiformaceae bacterium]
MTHEQSTRRRYEHERVSRDEKRKAMEDLREQARETGSDEGRDQRGGPGDWPGKDLTRNTLPGAESEEEVALPDDIQRDISQDGVVDDPGRRVERAP